MRTTPKTSKISPATRAVFQVKIESLAEELRIIHRRVVKARRAATKSLLHREAVRVAATLLATESRDQEFANSRAYRRDMYACVMLESHARRLVKPEVRHALLAYGFVRGMPYNRMEQSCLVAPIAKDISRIVNSLWQDYSEINVKPTDIEAWLAATPDYNI